MVLRPGRDVILISWGAMMKETLEAAEQLSHENIEVEVIDVATLKPLDTATILESVERTGRLVIIHEAPITCGFGAEIAARVAARALTSLLAPIERVAGYDTVMPYPRTEAFYMPSVDRIIAAVRRTMAYS
jgi:pyruvate dehydrogenase E1 component beta subunit